MRKKTNLFTHQQPGDQTRVSRDGLDGISVTRMVWRWDTSVSLSHEFQVEVCLGYEVLEHYIDNCKHENTSLDLDAEKNECNQ